MTTDLIDTLVRLEIVLRKTAPTFSSRLRPGLTAVEIEGKVASFSWAMSHDVRILNQWHDGLSGTSKTLKIFAVVNPEKLRTIYLRRDRFPSEGAIAPQK